jgi:hypothetical protein
MEHTMFGLVDYPLLTFLVSFVVLWLAATLGTRYADRVSGIRDDFSTITAAILTLLGLILGFTFSMAVGRYDLRKSYEEQEANAIGTEYLRVQLLPNSAETVRGLLREYLDQRIRFYSTRDRDELKEIDAATSQLQAKLWTATRDAALNAPSPLTSLAASGMNDVLNSQGYTQASWLNRIPRPAWMLLGTIAICANIMVGLSFRKMQSHGILTGVLPAIVSIALFLIADIDSPRTGLIPVSPENLMSLAASMRDNR